jgi:NADPH:quinone reductase-like Zn-dependent oxidoreductase
LGRLSILPVKAQTQAAPIEILLNYPESFEDAVWFRRGLLLIVSPDSQASACPLSGRNSTYRAVRNCGATSVVTVTARQMLFDYAHATAGQTILIHGAAGNVGAYAVQLAAQNGLHVTAIASSADVEYVRSLGAESVVDYQKERFEEAVTGMDVVLDTVGGDTQQRSLSVLKPGGIIVSVVAPVPDVMQKRYGIRAAYFYVQVTRARLNKIAGLFDGGKLLTRVGTLLPLDQARVAHLMLAGARPKRGKIVLKTAA